MITVALAMFAAAAIGLAVYDSLDPNNYFYYSPEDMAEFKHPTGSVLLVVLFMLLETSVVAAVFLSRRPSPLWGRGMIGLLVLLPWS